MAFDLALKAKRQAKAKALYLKAFGLTSLKASAAETAAVAKAKALKKDIAKVKAATASNKAFKKEVNGLKSALSAKDKEIKSLKETI